MTLTSEHLATLQRPFALNDHEFLKDLVYITEGAITTRIEEVDPAWELTGLGITHRNTFGSDVQVTVIVRLTICGVSREGVGSAKVIGKTTAWNDAAKKKMPLPEEEHQEVNEAEKSAATDALKRAARLFGIGRYLLALPDEVKTPETLAKHLASLNAMSRETFITELGKRGIKGDDDTIKAILEDYGLLKYKGNYDRMLAELDKIESHVETTKTANGAK